ncbi:MAG: Ppx/GppA family phosphatase [Campylobacterales bacterium]
MAKVTAVIDIGSNSVRMAVFERTSRFGFHLLKEAKSRVRISENAWKNGGMLQPQAIDRAIAALDEFVQIARAFGARKILTVATSAVRDAPNKADFVRQVRQQTGLQIRVIDGLEEAQMGGLAAVNLLPLDEGITIDIGGGSTELALIQKGRVVDRISFNLGTVRLKELFFDSTPDVEGALRFVYRALKVLPPHFKSRQIIGVGGTLRALSSVLMKREHYPLNVLHGYRYALEGNRKLLSEIIRSEAPALRRFGFKPERLDVIREGVLIFTRVARKIGAVEAITSGVGVREGVFLNNMLRSSGGCFPAGFQPSAKSLIDRFRVDERLTDWTGKTVGALFDALYPLHGLDPAFKRPLLYAAKLLPVGEMLDTYDRAEHGYYIAFHGLSYGFEHPERILIAKLIKAQQKKELHSYTPPAHLKQLLPSAVTVRWLSFMLYLANTLNAARNRPDVAFSLSGRTLEVKMNARAHLAKEAVARLKPPFNLELAILGR